MGLFGAIVGGGIGGAIGGPIGAIIGAIIGGGVTSGIPTSSASRHQHSQVAFFVCFFSCLAKMAIADGTISQEEIDYVEELMDNNFQLDARTKDLAKKVFLEAKDNETPASSYLEQFGNIVNYDPQLCTMLVGALKELAQRDGHTSTQEKVIIEDAQRILRLNNSNYNNSYRSNSNSYASSPNNKLEEAYDFLECDESMSDTEIKKKYREKCAEFHPDKLQSKGLPDEFMKFATEQMTKINSAYDIITKSR